MEPFLLRSKTLLISAICAIFLLSALSGGAQRYVNEEFADGNGEPIDLHYSTSMLASSGHHMTVGNTHTSGEGANILLVKREEDGSIVWEKEYDSPDHMNDYGVAIAEDPYGDFIVAGASYRSNSGSYEIVVLKFDASGQLEWEHFYNGTANGDDIPCGVSMHGPDVVVAGTVENASSMTDIVTFRLKGNGSPVWTQTYDHNQLDDAAAKLDVNSNSGVITVVGGSAEQANLYDMVTLKYEPSGVQIDEHRSDYSVGIDRPTAFGKDSSGNSIVSGFYFPSSGDMEMLLFSLDDTLGLNWYDTYDPTPNEDKITDIAVAPSGAIFTVGYVEVEPGYFQCHVARYDASGNLVWEEKYQEPEGGAKGKRIKIDSDGQLNIAGIAWQDTDTNLLTLQYHPSGELLMSEVYDAGGDEVSEAIETDPFGNIYLHGTSTNNGEEYLTVKYNVFEREMTTSIDTSGFEYVDGELVVQFQPDAVRNAPFDTKAKSFGKLEEFLTQEAVDKLNATFEQYFGGYDAVKVFPRMTRADTVSVSRLGDTVQLHHFWSTLVLVLPSSMDEQAVVGTMNDELRDVIYHAELNLVGELYDIPNDPDFNQQVGFESNNTPENDINMDRAWDIHHGNETAKVGVFDTGLDWGHEDFSNTGSGSYNDSKVYGGWDFVNNTHISNSSDPNGHGTNCAGLIGAIRNNNTGIAGVAGGDESVGNTGVELFGFKILSLSNQASVDKAASAMVEGAAHNPNTGYGYGLHVLNSSWGITPSHSQYSASNRSLFFQTNKSVYDNEAVSVLARGNDDDDNESIPATIGPDHFLVSTGANGQGGDRAGFSSYGKNVDIVAPGVLSLVHTTHPNDQYGDFNGTSAAAPHVAGVAGLLISNANDPAHWNLPNSLGPDDVENLIEIYRSDVGPSGYDAENGWGRLNAGLVMEHMEWPHYWVEHFGGSTQSYSSTQIASNQQLELVKSMNGVAAGTYIGDIYRIEFTVSHNIGNADLLNAWARNTQATSNMLNGDQVISDVPQAELVSADPNQAVIRGHIFYLSTDLLGQPVNTWVPFQDGDVVEYGYSLHLYDESATSTEDHETGGHEFSVHPNPAKEGHRLLLPEGERLRVELLDLQGRPLRTVFQGDVEGQRAQRVDLSGLSSGMYFYRLHGASDQEPRTLKFIKR